MAVALDTGSVTLVGSRCWNTHIVLRETESVNERHRVWSRNGHRITNGFRETGPLLRRNVVVVVGGDLDFTS